MAYEVEQKYRLDDVQAFERKLRELGVSFGREMQQADRYFAHPCRDFAATDEALRIRSVNGDNWVTYKGPKIDSETKTRRELELLIDEGLQGAEQFGQLLTLLGFREVLTVCKQRRKTHLLWQEQEVEVVMDHIEGLGDFTELEIISQESGLDQAKKALLSLASELGLKDPTRKSYLELLLES